MNLYRWIGVFVHVFSSDSRRSGHDKSGSGHALSATQSSSAGLRDKQQGTRMEVGKGANELIKSTFAPTNATRNAAPASIVLVTFPTGHPVVDRPKSPQVTITARGCHGGSSRRSNWT